MENYKKSTGKSTRVNAQDEDDYSLDITSEVCPLTFVKTILLIERMESGQTAVIFLPSGEAAENVPRAVIEHGHQILDITPDSPEVFRLRVRKG